MFTDFCCGSFFRIIFTSIFPFNQRFKIFINKRCCLIRFLVLIKLEYLSVSEKYYNTTRIFIFADFFYETQVCFLFYMNEDNSNNKNHQHVLTLFHLIMQIIFLLQDNLILLRLKSLKE